MTKHPIPIWKIVGGAFVHFSPIAFALGAGEGFMETTRPVLLHGIVGFGGFVAAGAAATAASWAGERLARSAPAGEPNGIELRNLREALRSLRETASRSAHGQRMAASIGTARWLPWTPERASLARDLLESSKSLAPALDLGPVALDAAAESAAQCLESARDALDRMAAREDAAAAGTATASASYMRARWSPARSDLSCLDDEGTRR